MGDVAIESTPRDLHQWSLLDAATTLCSLQMKKRTYGSYDTLYGYQSQKFDETSFNVSPQTHTEVNDISKGQEKEQKQQLPEAQSPLFTLLAAVTSIEDEANTKTSTKTTSRPKAKSMSAPAKRKFTAASSSSLTQSTHKKEKSTTATGLEVSASASTSNARFYSHSYSGPLEGNASLSKRRRFTSEFSSAFGDSGYSPAEREAAVRRYLAKRPHRVWTKKIKYNVRKTFADSRLRVKGRFVSKEDEAKLRDGLMLAF